VDSIILHWPLQQLIHILKLWQMFHNGQPGKVRQAWNFDGGVRKAQQIDSSGCFLSQKWERRSAHDNNTRVSQHHRSTITAANTHIPEIPLFLSFSVKNLNQ
jgi:hypothetical protein